MISHLTANPLIILKEEIDGWGLLLNPDDKTVLVINPVGVSIWKSLTGLNDIEAIIEEIKCLYLDVPQKIREDIETFINDLEDRGFVGSIIDIDK